MVGTTGRDGNGRDADAPDEAVLDAICDLLDSGRSDEALVRVRELRAGVAGGDGDPVLDFLEGAALVDLARPGEALAPLRRAVEADPADPEFRVNLAFALFRALRFEEAREALAPALAADEVEADAWHLHGLLLEREGRFAEADAAFEAAAELDAERYPVPARLDEEEFRAETARAMEALPETFRRHLDDVPVTVEPLPSDDLLAGAEDPPFEPDELLGLFVGPTLAERGAFETLPDAPPQILLFQRNLERACLDADELRGEIAVTVYHELGHYLGMDEEDLERVDLD